MAELAAGFSCPVCTEWHAPLPLSYSAKAPLVVMRLPAEERVKRVVMNPDQCVVDNKFHFLRGRIVVPMLDHGEPFIWGVWAQVSSADFFRTQQRWTMPGRELESPFPGRLDTELPLFGHTVDLPVAVQTQVVGRRPHFAALMESHPLTREQRAGITLKRAAAIAGRLLHGDGK